VKLKLNNMAQQTAVEWLIKEFNLEEFKATIEFAKAKEREQIEEAYVDGFLDGGENIYNIGIYYNKKYTNGL
jgi:hypothetical protein